MTDGVILNPGSGGPTVDTETNAGRANAQMQRMKLVLGDIDTDAGDVSLANPVPVGFSAVNYTYSTVNTTTAQLQGEAWQLLLSRIGDTLMLFLLMHTSLFLPLPNGCFLQVTGASIAEVSQSVLQTRYLNAFASA